MAESPTANNDIAAIIIKDEPFDLLDSETYQSDEAASYFQTLDDEMTRSGMNIKPGNGHLATTCPKEAAQWGKAVSIWPLGENGVEFAWLERGGVFWPRPNAKKEMNILTFPTKYESASSSIMVKDGMLENALQGDAWEIMFRADNGFLAVSSNIDSDLRRYLVEL